MKKNKQLNKHNLEAIMALCIIAELFVLSTAATAMKTSPFLALGVASIGTGFTTGLLKQTFNKYKKHSK